MKKKIIIAAAAVLIAGGLFIPVPKTYADGTKTYNALAYKIVKWNRPFYKNLMFTETEVYRFPHSLKSIDKLWEGMIIDPEVSTVTGSVVKKSEDGIFIEVSESTGELSAGEIIEIPLEKGKMSDLVKRDRVKVEFVPSVSQEKNGVIDKVVDIQKEGEETASVQDKESAEKTVSETEGARPKISREYTPSPAKRVEEKTTVKSTSPVPNSYSFNSADTLHYIRMSNTCSENRKYPYAVFIKSRAELDSFFNKNQSEYDFASKDYSSKFSKLNEKYTDKFFENKALIIIVTSESSGSNYYVGVFLDEARNEIRVNRYKPPVGTCDMAYWFIMDEVDKNNALLSKNAGSVKVKIVDSNTCYDTSSTTHVGNIGSDVYVSNVAYNNAPGLLADDAAAVKKIINKYSFKDPGYDNISDINIMIDTDGGKKYYYYDSSSGIITVNGKGVNSDKAVKITEEERMKLNGIIAGYTDLGVIL